MKKLSAFFLLGLPLALTAQGNFYPITDPQFGPDSVIVDAVSGLAWLEPSLSTNLSFDAVNSLPFFSGYRHASNEEVRTLFSHVGLHETTIFGGYEPSQTITDFVKLFAPTSYQDGWPELTAISALLNRPAIDFGYFNDKPLYAVWGFTDFGVGPSAGFSDVGNWLVQVPEPNTWALLLFGLPLLAVFIRKDWVQAAGRLPSIRPRLD